MDLNRSKFSYGSRFTSLCQEGASTEFASVEQLAILQSAGHPADQVRLLQERLATEFSDKAYPTLTYHPSLACFLGIDALGIMVLEDDLGTVDYDEEFLP